MPIDRSATLKAAEKLIKQGKLERAIQEYVRLLAEQPGDWNTVNALGDLYARAGQPAQAMAQFTRVADHLFEEGFFAKAAALYKKGLKTDARHEHSLMRLAEIAAHQGLAADARLFAGQVAALRRSRGDERGAHEPTILLGALDDPELKLAAGRAARAIDDNARAAALFRGAAAAFARAGRGAASVEALVEAAKLTPGDASCVDAALDMAGPDGTIDDAAPALETLLTHVPYIPVLERIVDVARRTGREGLLRQAQERLADAYLAAGRGSEAAALADSLGPHGAGRAGEESFRNALDQSGVPEPQPELDDIRAALDQTLEHFYTAAGTAPSQADPPPTPPRSAASAEPAASTGPSAARPAETNAGEPIEVDLTDALVHLASARPAAVPAAPAEPQDLEAIFEQFRTRVREQDGEGPSEQLRRGVELLEQGRVAEAADELRAAARAPMLRFAAASKLGYTYSTAGDLDQAAEWLERAAEAPASSLDEGFAVLYELADVLERKGDRDRALNVLLALDADAPSYRDVPARIEHLTRPRAGSRGL